MQSERRTPVNQRLTTSRLATPPPVPIRGFPAGIGWVDGQTIGFRGFDNELDAAHAAAVAYRAMEQRLTGGRAFTVSPANATATISSSGDAEFVVVDGHSIARLVRLGSMQEGAAGSVAFELEVPVPISIAGIRDMAGHLYREMQEAGAMRGGVSRTLATRAPSGESAIDRWLRSRMLGAVAAVIAVLIMFMVAAVFPSITAAHIVMVLGGIAGAFAVVALASLVGLMLQDVRLPRGTDRRRQWSGWQTDQRFAYAAKSRGPLRD